MRDTQAKDLWGPEAYGYYGHIYFPAGASWKEIAEVMKNSRTSHTVYVKLTNKDFKVFDPDYMPEKFESRNDRAVRHEYVAFTKWRARVLRRSCLEQVDMEFYNDHSLVCRVCTEEGDRGDEYGFGVEPDMWASALFNFDGNIILPFAPGYIPDLHEKY